MPFAAQPKAARSVAPTEEAPRIELGVVPRATYRLQFNAGFTFADAEKIVPYLARLGISHVYASPFLRARSGSSHGYDITDHNSLNLEIGDETAFRSFVAVLRQHGMGLMIDFVPNHMGIGKADNAWWLDVLAWGQASPYAHYFDINWHPANAALQGKLLVPLLGDHYGTVLEDGQLVLTFDDESGAFQVTYHDHIFPIGPPHFARVLVAALRDWPQEDAATIAAITDLARDFRALGTHRIRVRDRDARRTRAAALQQTLARSFKFDPAHRRYIETCLSYFNGRPGDTPSFMALHRLLQRQAYRLAYWRVAADEINYRRFFDINELAGLRVEDPELFDTLHRRVGQWIKEDLIQGLRIDHIDGLFDPADYCRKLRRLVPDRSLYIVVEKILGADEPLRADWSVDGTTGYETANLINALFVDPRHQQAILKVYGSQTGATTDYPIELAAAKRQIMDTVLASELQVLADELDRIGESNWRTRDFTRNDMARVLVAAITMLPIYRTYVDARGATAEDRHTIEKTIAAARRAHPGIDASLFDFLQSVWTTDLVRLPRSGYSRRQVIRYAMKLQQFTGPVMAKAMEDTAFYRYAPLASLNDVGGEPDRFGTTVEMFHAENEQRFRDWPANMVATTTHDSKRSEDVRARINVISELPDEWRHAVSRWRNLNRTHRKEWNGYHAPSARDEYLLYQTLVGAWPLQDLVSNDNETSLAADFVSRIQGYMTKAMREAKQETSWVRPDLRYEEAVTSFIAAILDAEKSEAFLVDFRLFASKAARVGMLNSLGQTALKLTLPGVPDIYQGAELWDFRLVDPDNRGPVDFTTRGDALAALADEQAAPRSMGRWLDGSVKMALTACLLDHRKRHPALYRSGAYVSLPVTGPAANHVCAFARVDEMSCLIVCVARLLASVAVNDGFELPNYSDGFWAGTEIHLTGSVFAGEFFDLLSARKIGVKNHNGIQKLDTNVLFASFPVSLLTVQTCARA